jgi:hypothetical protein
MQTLIPLAVTKIPARTKAEAYTWVHAHFSVGMHVVQCFHDDDCRALETHRDADCSPTCKPDWYLLTFVDEQAGRLN